MTPGLTPITLGRTIHSTPSLRDHALAERLIPGATIRDLAQDAGRGMVTATVLNPFGNIVDIIQNRHFERPPTY